MQVRAEDIGTVRVVTTVGYIDESGQKEVARNCTEYMDGGGKSIVLDFYGSRSGYGASILRDTVESILARDCAVHICNVGLLIRMSLSGYEHLFFESRHDALAAFQSVDLDPHADGHRVILLSATQELVRALHRDIALIHKITPEQFELLICDRLDAMGHEVRRTGHTFAKDGGIDIVAWPKRSSVPFLLGVQVKHRRNSTSALGPKPVKDLLAVLGSAPFDAGMLVTNTTFTPDARWWSKHGSRVVRLRELEDLRKWVEDNFLDGSFREMPEEIELAPGVVIRLR